MERNERVIADAIYAAFNHNDKEYSDEEKNKAAYALNLCTVSVGQIIDYADLEIMEQEYEYILNNLDLQNMPKDQALLNILNQLLDVISFFRIQQEEKDKIEKEYQLKMKNAIWNSLPNFAVLITGGKGKFDNLVQQGTRLGEAFLSAGLSELPRLAMMIGICYMNYRKNTSQYRMEKDEELWKLHKSEMEQFHALQRELFTTSWRLADAYGFDDRLRLSERQIRQYNEILQDKDAYRRYDRLYAQIECFKAYPPFLYYLANTANMLSQMDERIVDKNHKVEISPAKRDEYLKTARKYYKELLDNKNYKILRADPIISACALEYIEIIDVDQFGSDFDEYAREVESYIKVAESKSGGAFDILELCALAYLRINKTEEAMTIFRRLFNEGYNQTINAQILSIYYVNRGFRDERNLLIGYVKDEYLYPIAENGEDKNKLNEIFLRNQIDLLSNNYCLVLKEYVRDRETAFSSYARQNKRYTIADLRKVYSRFFNDMLCDLNELLQYSEEELLDVTKKLVWYLNHIESDVIKKTPEAKIFEDWTFELIEKSIRKIDAFEEQIDFKGDLDSAMKYLSTREDSLRRFIKKTNMTDPHKVDDMFISDEFELLKPFEEFDSDEEKEKRRKVKEATYIVQEYAKKVVINETDSYFLVRNDNNEEEFIQLLLDNKVEQKCWEYYFAMIKKGTNKKSETILFNDEGIKVCATVGKSYPYSAVTSNKGNSVKFDGYEYTNDHVNVSALLNMIAELNDRCQHNESQFDRLFAGYTESVNRRNNKVEFISTIRQLFN